MKKLTFVFVLSAMATLSACSSGGGSGSAQPVVTRVCSTMELSAFNDIYDSLNNRSELRRACSSFYRANRDNSSCTVTSNVHIRTRSQVIRPGDTLTITPSEVKEVCGASVGQNGGGSGRGPVLPREGSNICSNEFRDLFAEAVRHVSPESCERFQNRFTRGFKCLASGDEYRAESVYSYCRHKLRR